MTGQRPCVVASRHQFDGRLLVERLDVRVVCFRGCALRDVG